MFEQRNGPMPGFRGRDGFNMGAGPLDRPPMDMKRFDCPPDRMGRSVGLFERGCDRRDLFRAGDKQDSNFRNFFEMEQNRPSFRGHERHPMPMGDMHANMPLRDIDWPDDQHMDMRHRDGDQRNRFDMSLLDIRRRLAVESLNINDQIRGRAMSQKGFNDLDGFNMDTPFRERPMMDFDRRGCFPLSNHRGRFESDMDFRNRIRSPGDFRDLSSQTFGNKDETPLNIRGRPVLPPDHQGLEKAGGMTLREREFPEQAESPSGLRDDFSKPLTEEWSSRSMREQKDRVLPGLGRDTKMDLSKFQDGERQSLEFSDKDRHSLDFSRSEREGPVMQNWEHVSTDSPVSDASWSGPQMPSSGNTPSRGRDGLPPKVKKFSVKERDDVLDKVSKKGNLMSESRDFHKDGSQDQDYRDVDYRTNSGQKYFILDKLEEHVKKMKESSLPLLERPNSSGSQV